MIIIYCLHGDENTTEPIVKDFCNKNNITCILGNPRARELNVRYIESDLNRSFNKEGTYEAERAKELKNELKDFNDDLVIDIHTTTAVTKPMGIITDLSKLRLASRLGIENLVLMKKEFSSGGSLIENVDNSISIEISTDQESLSFLYETLIKGLDDRSKINKFNLFEVVEIIKKADNKYKDIKNLEKLPDGFYPAFYGEKSYEDIAYLKTVRKNINI